MPESMVEYLVHLVTPDLDAQIQDIVPEPRWSIAAGNRYRRPVIAHQQNPPGVATSLLLQGPRAGCKV